MINLLLKVSWNHSLSDLRVYKSVVYTCNTNFARPYAGGQRFDVKMAYSVWDLKIGNLIMPEASEINGRRLVEGELWSAVALYWPPANVRNP